MRVSPQNIQELQEKEIFVFGSNLAGIHGAGAAKQALQWGAKHGDGIGLRGQTYAIPTKNHNIETLSLSEIQVFVNSFLESARERQDLTFLVTEIGCGLAGYSPQDIAPLFKEAVKLENVYLPKSFIK